MVIPSLMDLEVRFNKFAKQFFDKEMENLKTKFNTFKNPKALLFHPKEYAQKNRTFAQNVSHAIGLNYISLERASQEKEKIP